MEQSIDLQNHIMRKCDEVSIGEHFDLTHLILIYVNLAKLITKRSIPSKSIHYLADLYFSGIFNKLHIMFDF